MIYAENMAVEKYEGELGARFLREIRITAM
jgi:hypothetical protein